MERRLLHEELVKRSGSWKARSSKEVGLRVPSRPRYTVFSPRHRSAETGLGTSGRCRQGERRDVMFDTVLVVGITRTPVKTDEQRLAVNLSNVARRRTRLARSRIRVSQGTRLEWRGEPESARTRSEFPSALWT